MFTWLKSLVGTRSRSQNAPDPDAAYIVQARSYALVLLHLRQVTQPQAYVVTTALNYIHPSDSIPAVTARFTDQIRRLHNLDMSVDRLTTFIGEKANASGMSPEARFELLSDCLILVMLAHEQDEGVGSLIGSLRRGLGITDRHATSKQLIEYADTWAVIKGLWGTDEHRAARDAIEIAITDTSFRFY